MASIEDNLRTAAKRSAKTATDRYIEGDAELFAVAAGLAVELSLKYRLAQESPLYLADGNSKQWFRNARALWQARDNAELLPSEIRTITAQEAFDRVIEIDSSCARVRSAFVDVMSARNNKAHMGLTGPRSAQDVFAQFTRAIEVVLGVSGDFWAPHEQLVRTLLDDLAAAIAKRVQEKLAAARSVFERRFGGLPLDFREAAIELAANTQTLSTNDDDVVAADCPACGSRATLGGSNRVEAIDSHSDYPMHVVYLETEWLRCPACGLHLEDEEELDEAGIDPEVENPDVDPADLFADWEPDEDYFSDR